MITGSQLKQLKSIERKPFQGFLNYFRSMQMDWNNLLEHGYISARLLSSVNGVDWIEYTITDAGRTALAEFRLQRLHR